MDITTLLTLPNAFAAFALVNIWTFMLFGLDKIRWLGWYATTPESRRFVAQPPYLFPTFQRHLVFWDYVIFWDIPRWESPGVPRGLADAGARSTYPAGSAQPAAVPDATAPR